MPVVVASLAAREILFIRLSRPSLAKRYHKPPRQAHPIQVMRIAMITPIRRAGACPSFRAEYDCA